MVALSGLTTVRVYALPSGRPLSEAIRYGTDISDIALSPDGRTIAASRPRAGASEIMDAPSLRHRARLPDSETLWDFLRFTPDGRHLMGASWKGWGRLWSTKTYKPVGRKIVGHAGRVDWMSMSPNGRTLATGGPDGTLRLWDLRTEQELGVPLPGLPNRVVVPQFSADGALPVRDLRRRRRTRVPLGREGVVLGPPRVQGRRAPAHAGAVARCAPGRDYDPAC